MPKPRSAPTAAVVALMAVLSQACAHRAPAAPRPPPRQFVNQLTVNDHPLTLHLARGTSPTLPLLVYATGDGGWRRKDLALYHKLVAWGYPVVGFSASEYVKHLSGDEETTTPGRLANDYAAIVNVARQELALPEATKVVVVGVSRGAGLAVVAAGQRALRDQLGGVVAIALTKEEEHVRWFRRTPGVARRNRVRVMLDLYEYLPVLGTIPISVIQSTHDNYLPSQAARALFGEETDRRQFHEIESRNHSFSDARARLYETLHRSLDWLTALISKNVTTP
jgi:pimeloyl-ACP methyl ester carboxylesterase